MSKLLLLLSLLSVSAFAETVSSGHYIRCKLSEGAGPAVPYYAWVTVHENVQPFEIVDASLYLPSLYTNTQPLRENMVTTGHDDRTSTSEGHGKKLVVSTSSLKLTADLYVPADHQRYSCAQH